jgi:hypothetical protein
MVKYIYATIEEAEYALLLVNNYYNLPCGITLTYTTIKQEEENGYYYLEALGLDEVLGNE